MLLRRLRVFDFRVRLPPLAGGTVSSTTAPGVSPTSYCPTSDSPSVGRHARNVIFTARVKKSLRIAPTVEAFLACVGAKSKDGQRASRRWICRGIPLSSRHGIIPDWTETQSRMDEQDKQGKKTMAAFRARPSQHRMCARTWACAGVVASDVEREARLWYQRSPVHSGRVPYAFRTRAVRVPYAFRWYL